MIHSNTPYRKKNIIKFYIKRVCNLYYIRTQHSFVTLNIEQVTQNDVNRANVQREFRNEVNLIHRICVNWHPPGIHLKYGSDIYSHCSECRKTLEIITVERYFFRNVKKKKIIQRKKRRGISRYIKHKHKIEFILPRRAAQRPYKKKKNSDTLIMSF